MGDGEMAEGQVWEAAEFAGHYKLDNLSDGAQADVNALGQSEPTMYQHDMEIYRKKFEAEGWAAEVIDGHDVAAILAALDRAKATQGRPQAIIARTIKGHGFSQVAGKENWHGKPFSKEQLAAAIQEIGGAPVVVPPDPGISYARANVAAAAGFSSSSRAGLFRRKTSRHSRGLWFCAETPGRRESADRGDFRRCEEFHILRNFSAMPTLTISTRATSPSRTWLVRESGLAAQGKVPFLDTFACFFSREPTTRFAWRRLAVAISTSAARNCGVSIGEDGPSQMALEDIAIFRAVHSSAVFYPSDAVSAERLTET